MRRIFIVFGAFAFAPNSIDDVVPSGWKLTAEVALSFALVRTETPARSAAGFSTRFRKFPDRTGTPLRDDGKSQPSGSSGSVPR